MSASATQPFRRAGRVDVSVDVNVQFGKERYRGVAENIGVGGVFLATARVLDPGELVTLDFSLPGAREPVWVQAVVRWVRDAAPSGGERASGMGLQFFRMPFEARAAVQAYLGSRDPVPDDGV